MVLLKIAQNILYKSEEEKKKERMIFLVPYNALSRNEVLQVWKPRFREVIGLLKLHMGEAYTGKGRAGV